MLSGRSLQSQSHIILLIFLKELPTAWKHQFQEQNAKTCHNASRCSQCIQLQNQASFSFFFFPSLFCLDSFCHTLCVHVNSHAGCRGIHKNLSLEYNCSPGRRPKQKAMQCTRAQPDLLGQVQAGLCSVRYSLSIASFKKALSRGAYWKLTVKGINL